MKLLKAFSGISHKLWRRRQRRRRRLNTFWRPAKTFWSHTRRQMRLVRLADQEKMPLAAPRGTEPVAHYKFASFARFRCARQKMSRSFNRLHTQTYTDTERENERQRVTVQGLAGRGISLLSALSTACISPWAKCQLLSWLARQKVCWNNVKHNLHTIFAFASHPHVSQFFRASRRARTRARARARAVRVRARVRLASCLPLPLVIMFAGRVRHAQILTDTLAHNALLTLISFASVHLLLLHFTSAPPHSKCLEIVFRLCRSAKRSQRTLPKWRPKNHFNYKCSLWAVNRFFPVG